MVRFLGTSFGPDALPNSQNRRVEHVVNVEKIMTCDSGLENASFPAKLAKSRTVTLNHAWTGGFCLPRLPLVVENDTQLLVWGDWSGEHDLPFLSACCVHGFGWSSRRATANGGI